MTVSPDVLDTDVLVIGGGPAATWAAISATESGARVILVDKGYCGTSGATAAGGNNLWLIPPGPRREESVREREQAEGSPQSRLIRIREQSASASSPRQQARPQSVRIRDEGTVSTVRDTAAATDADTPQTDRDSELSVATASPLIGNGRESKQPKGCPVRRIVVATSPPTNFRVHIHIISTNVRI